MHSEKENDDLLIITMDEFNFYRLNSDLKINAKMVSSLLLYKMLTDNNYYKHLVRLANDEVKSYKISYLTDNGLSKYPIDLSKKDIVLGIDKCLEEGKFTLNDKDMANYFLFKNKTSFSYFAEKMKDSKFSVSIDNTNYMVSCSSIFEFLELEDDEYNKFLSSEVDSVNGIDKDKFIYIVVTFFNKYDILSNYFVSDKLTERVEKLEVSEKIDIEAFNEFLDVDNRSFKDVLVNQELVDEVLRGIPEGIEKLEKACYVYIKLCKLLTYDDEFYALNSNNYMASQYRNIDNLKDISLENNKVVCYNFTLLYAYILDKLGIKFKLNISTFSEFSGGHANLEFRDDKFLVLADSVKSILNSDLTNAKLNDDLNGFRCLNQNRKTREEFDKKIVKIYRKLIEEEIASKSFSDTVSRYKDISNIENIDFDEKIMVVMDVLATTKLSKMDVFSYLMKLKHIVFSSLEQERNFNISIVRKINEDYSASSNLVITINKKDLVKFQSANVYYIHDGANLRISSREELRGLFKDGVYSYINNYEHQIPGLDNRYGGRRW